MEIHRSNDTSLSLCGQPLTTEQVSALIERLAEERVEMNPPVASTYKAAGVGVAEDPAISILRAADGELVLLLRHPGLGWCAFGFTDRAAATLRDALATHTTGVPTKILSLTRPENDVPQH